MSRISIALAVSSLVITLTGDILLDRGVRQVIDKHGIDQLFSSGIDSVLQSSDVVVGNLECPATKIKAPVFKQYIFRRITLAVELSMFGIVLPTSAWMYVGSQTV